MKLTQQQQPHLPGWKNANCAYFLRVVHTFQVHEFTWARNPYRFTVPNLFQYDTPGSPKLCRCILNKYKPTHITCPILLAIYRLFEQIKHTPPLSKMLGIMPLDRRLYLKRPPEKKKG